MKKTLVIFSFLAFAVVSCSKGDSGHNYQEETMEMETLEEELDESINDLEAEEADMEHDVDSLLEGI